MTKKTCTTPETRSGGNSPTPPRRVTTADDSGGNSPTPPKPPKPREPDE